MGTFAWQARGCNGGVRRAGRGPLRVVFAPAAAHPLLPRRRVAHDHRHGPARARRLDEPCSPHSLPTGARLRCLWASPAPFRQTSIPLVTGREQRWQGNEERAEARLNLLLRLSTQTSQECCPHSNRSSSCPSAWPATGVLLFEICTGEMPLQGRLKMPAVPEQCPQARHPGRRAPGPLGGLLILHVAGCQCPAAPAAAHVGARCHAAQLAVSRPLFVNLSAHWDWSS